VIRRAIKRAFDVTASSVGLVTLSPALLLIGAAIRLESPGPALFRQERVGKDGRVFRLVKFRTMRTGAPVEFRADGSTRVSSDDSRLTKLGRVLRGGVDELPQLLNVLRGEMSLVGPRPDMPVHAATYSDAERGKLAVKPGMTSLAAVLGRNQLFWRTRIAIDLRYIEHWDLGLDLAIIAQTIALPFGRQLFRFDHLVDGIEMVKSTDAT
jgi:lipopolysaccharide/colanic/teichoic acid biosynthesis glycosyltransferase